MDWIERLFGVNLDGGDGTAETMVMLAGVVVLGAVMVTRVPILRDYLRAMFGHRMR